MITKDIKNDFPIFRRLINNNPLVYLDNSATTQMPMESINILSNYYINHKANVHRGVHTLSEESTQMYEDARKKISLFIGARSKELIFVKNTTEACNLVAESFLKNLLKEGDTIALSEYEHHSDLIPWRVAAQKLGLNIIKIPFNEEYCVDIDSLSKLEFKFIAINHVSNFLGSLNDIEKISEIAKNRNAYVFVDGAQSISHKSIDVKKLNVDFFAFSGHKLYGPFGSGGLYVKEELYEKASPYMYGGGMIREVSFEDSNYVDFAEKFDAGTPNVADNISLAKSIEYIEKLGKKNIFNHESRVLEYLYNSLDKLEGVEIYGPKKLQNRSALVSFNVKGIHSHDLASILDGEGIAIRSGQHCTMPAHNKLNILASARASLGLYNFNNDVDALILGIKKAQKILL